MLVCSVSQLQRRAGIAAEVAEVAAALDASGTGNVVFATLVDDPASVGDVVDAFLGQIMREAANAAAAVSAGVAYAVAVVEAAAAADSCSVRVPVVLSAAVTEAGAASDACSTASATVQTARVLSAARAGVGSVAVSDDGNGKTRIIADVGAVT